MSPEILAIVMFLTTLLFLLFGFPVAFTLAGSSLIFAFIGDLLGVFNFKMLLFFPVIQILDRGLYQIRFFCFFEPQCS